MQGIKKRKKKNRQPLDLSAEQLGFEYEDGSSSAALTHFNIQYFKFKKTAFTIFFMSQCLRNSNIHIGGNYIWRRLNQLWCWLQAIPRPSPVPHPLPLSPPPSPPRHLPDFFRRVRTLLSPSRLMAHDLYFLPFHPILQTVYRVQTYIARQHL